MGSSYLVGTAPDQVPTNADLGGLAFQNPEAVAFSGGKGALEDFSLNAVYKEITATAIDVFVYDTRKDSDGGAWRSRCQNLSWYNETLNTTTRGSRRDFPAVAVIVLVAGSLTIYDGDSPDLPMWMVFQFNGNTAIRGMSIPTATTMLNGVLCACGQESGGISYNSGFYFVTFLKDTAQWKSEAHAGVFGYGIKDRNLTTGYSVAAGTSNDGSVKIAARDCFDVAMTVLPNAPIDSVTGLPIPTIAVATQGGVSVLHTNGTVANLLTQVGQSTYVLFTKFGGIQTHGGGGVAYMAWGFNTIPTASTNNPDYALLSTSRFSWASNYIMRGGGDGNSQPYPACVTNEGFACLENAGSSTTNKLITIAANKEAFGYSLVNYMTTKYNTGWMPGNIQGAWLSDTTQETVVGSGELITNGDFGNGLTGWTDQTGESTVTGGQLNFIKTTASWSGIYSNVFPTVVGKTYEYSYTVTAHSGNQVRVHGMSSSGITLSAPMYHTTGTFTFSFVAATTQSQLLIGTVNSATVNASFDNITCRLADVDRSLNLKGLCVYGSITKSPVATGADLVGYSGFSGSNYMIQPYNSALNSANTPRVFIGWVKTSSTSDYQYIMTLTDGVSVWNGIAIQSSTGYPYMYSTDGGQLVSTSNVVDGQWHMVVGVEDLFGRRLYVDGRLGISETRALTSISAYTPQLYVGRANWSSGSISYPFQGSISLCRFTSTPPSPEQISKMYNDEKVLFQDGAKATLYGTSDLVNALAYDEDTKLLHVGTSSGRSTFQGLRRVDNTTTAVATSISASNGMIVEN